MKYLLIVLIIFSVLCCSMEKTKTPKSIGSVRMTKDGTLVFLLRAQSDDGSLGDSYFEKRKEDKDYKVFLRHVFPIEPGEEKFVKPWDNDMEVLKIS